MRLDQKSRPGGGVPASPAAGTPIAGARTYAVPADAAALFDSIT